MVIRVDAGFNFQFPGYAPPNAMLRFNNTTQNESILGLQVKNQSNCLCAVYVNRNVGSNPEYYVLAYQVDAQPIPGASFITLQWIPASGAAPIGLAYVVITTERITANSAPLSAVVGNGIWDSSSWDNATFS